MSLSAALDSLLSLAREYENDLREARLEIRRLEIENEELRRENTTVILGNDEEYEKEIVPTPLPPGGIFSFLFAEKK
ncbi:hypothetical protein EBZ80_05040 [bacterium]|nr:hypothetical protein [bacterium]